MLNYSVGVEFSPLHQVVPTASAVKAIISSAASQNNERNDNHPDLSQSNERNVLRAFLISAFCIYAVFAFLWVLKSQVKKNIVARFCSPQHYGNTILPTSSQSTHHFTNISLQHHIHKKECSSRVGQWIRRKLLRQNYDSFPNHQLDLNEDDWQSWSVLQVAQFVHVKLIQSTRQNINTPNSHQHIYGQSIIDSSPMPTSSVFCFFSTKNNITPNYNNGGQDDKIIMNGTSTQPNLHLQYLYDQNEEFFSNGSIESTVQMLMQQRIDGASLPHLRLEHLCNFGVPFGLGVHLMSHLNQLVPAHRVERSRRSIGKEDLPSWYQNDGGSVRGFEENNTTTLVLSGNDTEQNENAMSERAQQIMRDRFGMTLPTLRDQNDLLHSGRGVDDHMLGARRAQKNDDDFDDVQTLTLNNNRTETQNKGGQRVSPPESTPVNNVLDSMPTHIREIAARRPDLVAQLLAEKQRQAQHHHHQQQLQQQQLQQQQQGGQSNTRQEPTFVPTSLSTILETERCATATRDEGSSDNEYATTSTTEDSSLMAIPSGNNKMQRGNARYRGLEMRVVHHEDRSSEEEDGTEDHFDWETMGLLRKRNDSKKL